MTERLTQFTEAIGISIRAFEQQIGASNGLIRKAITNKTDIQSKWLTSIAENYPQINMDWLLTGKGEMLKESPTSGIKIGNKNKGVSIGNTLKDSNISYGTESLASLNLENQFLKKEVDHLKDKLKEKERTIQILLKQNN